MAMIKDDVLDFSDYSDQDLVILKNKIRDSYHLIEEQCAEEMGKLLTDDFDQYSARGKKKMDKLASKYADKLSNLEIVFEDLKLELKKRNIYLSPEYDITDDEEEQSEIISETNKELSEIEFLRNEEEKTENIRTEYKIERRHDSSDEN